MLGGVVLNLNQLMDKIEKLLENDTKKFYDIIDSFWKMYLRIKLDHTYGETTGECFGVKLVI